MGFRLLHCATLQQESMAGLRATAAALLSGQQTLPKLLDAQSTSEITSTETGPAWENAAGWKVPLPLQLVNACVQQKVSNQHSQRQPTDLSSGTSDADAAGGVPERSAVGGAVMLPGMPEYLFCSHDCAALAWCTWAALLSCHGEDDQHTQTAHADTLNGASSSHSQPAQRARQSSVLDQVKPSPLVQRFDVGKVTACVQHSCSLNGSMHPSEVFGSMSTGDPGQDTLVSSSQQRPVWLPAPAAGRAAALQRFYAHADSSNDIFRVAARAVATVSSCAHMLAHVHNGQEQPSTVHKRDKNVGSPAASVAFEHIQAAWLPFQAVYHKVWWEHVPMPDDLDDEAEWRSELRCVLSALACWCFALLLLEGVCGLRVSSSHTCPLHSS